MAKPAPVPKPAEKPAPKSARPPKPKLPAETLSVETVTQTSVEAPSRPESAEPSQVIVTVTSPPKETKRNTGGGSLKVDNTQSESLSLKWF
uniref:PEST proteolytic signal-containing nuclear protein n=1 Tax=Panagrellus redivivus TaxID=6233 RepID=A0A7E5A0N5_PANRE